MSDDSTRVDDDVEAHGVVMGDVEGDVEASVE